MEEGEEHGESPLQNLPEDCIATILAHTSPIDACRVSLVSASFCAASRSDVLWRHFLPVDIDILISRSSQLSSTFHDIHSQKALYFRLCDSFVLIDDNTKSLSLERWSGKKCFMIGSKSLRIVWSDTANYWAWSAMRESRFSEVAKLLSVCWLEIRGSIRTHMLSPKTNYAAYFVFKWADDSFGFRNRVEFYVGGAGGESEKRHVYIRGQTVRQRVGLGGQMVVSTVNRDVRERGDGWLEVEMGEYFNSGLDDEELEMSVMEIDGGNWKHGLIVEGIEIRPKSPSN